MNEGRFTLRYFENLHIPLWLLKDTCWMMEWKELGILMIVPTVSVALIIALRTRKVKEFWVNAAICFWIMANAYWMCCEFASHVELKFYAAIPFGLGIICTVIFFIPSKRKP